MLRLSDRTSYGEGSRLGGCRGFSGAPVFAVRGVPLLVGIVGGANAAAISL